MPKKDSIFTLRTGVSRSQFERRLLEILKFEPAYSEEFERVCYDTFDRRLYRAGLILEADGRERGIVITLRPVAATTELAKTIVSSVPRFCADFASAPLRTRLLDLARMRILLPWSPKALRVDRGDDVQIPFPSILLNRDYYVHAMSMSFTRGGSNIIFIHPGF